MGIYKGNPEENFYKRISFDGEILESTEQLNWGYYSGGPMNTADLILTHHLNNDPSIELRNAFSKDIISKFEKDKEFTLTSEEIDEWLETQGIKTNSTVKNENIVKKVCAELGISQAELGRQLDVPASTVGTWASGKIPKMAEVALELMLENKRKDEILTAIKKAHEMIARI